MVFLWNILDGDISGGYKHSVTKENDMATNSHHIDQSTITLPTGHTVKRGTFIDIYCRASRGYRGAIIEGWSKSGRSLTIRRVQRRLRRCHQQSASDLNGEIVTFSADYSDWGDRDVMTVRYDKSSGEYVSSKHHGVSTHMDPLPA